VIVIMFVVMTMPPLRCLFPLNHKKLMFTIMFMIVMSLVGTKPKRVLSLNVKAAKAYRERNIVQWIYEVLLPFRKS